MEPYQWNNASVYQKGATLSFEQTLNETVHIAIIYFTL